MRLYHAQHSLPLSDVLPILENLGLRVVTERPYAIRARDGQLYWLQDFSMSYALSHDIAVAEVRDEFEDAFARIWSGEAENDSFNRLLLGTQLNWREIALLRAYARYLRQLQFPFSVEYVAETLADHLHITATIVELFLTRFSPDFDGDDSFREARERAIEQRILDALEQVPNLGQDRIIRQFVCVVKATLRTNFFQFDAQAGDGPTAQDVMPLRDDMGDAGVVEDGRLGTHQGQDAHELLKVGHTHKPPRRIVHRFVRGNDPRPRVGCRKRQCVRRRVGTLDRQ